MQPRAMADEITITSHSLLPGQPGPATSLPVAQLFVSLDCERPHATKSRHVLAGVKTVLLRRGVTLAARREHGAAGASLVIDIPDPRMSQDHARISAIRGGWALEDAGSKNGTGLNGVAVKQAGLSDGDFIEVGHTFLLFRDEVAATRAGELDLYSDALRPAAGGLATFVAELQSEYDAVEQVAASPIPILFLGETGTGKEIAARALHRLSGRGGPFVGVNCGALAPTLVEAQLFGHKKGAFTGAAGDSPGLVRSADRGTLFLDEVGELPLPAQVALLRVLQEQEVVPVGGTHPVKVDVRVCAATLADVEEAIAQRKFREDLYARLAGMTVRLPSLAERREDLGLLIAAILARAPGGAGARFTAAATRCLHSYEWPRNVRELEKCLLTALTLAGAGSIDVDHLPDAVRAASVAASAVTLDPEEQAIRDELHAQLAAHGGNVAAVARAMGKARTQIHRWVKRFGLRLHGYRVP